MSSSIESRVCFLVVLVLAGCSAKLTHPQSGDGLRYRVRRNATISVAVFAVERNNQGTNVAREILLHAHPTPVGVVDTKTRIVNLNGACLASHDFTVAFHDDGTLKSIKLDSESEAEETLLKGAGVLEKLPAALENLLERDKAEDATRTAALEAETKRLQAEKALLDARKALEEALRPPADEPGGSP